MKKKAVSQAILLVLAAIAWAAYDYFRLPAYSLRSFEAWILAAAVLAAAVLVFALFGRVKKAILASFIAFAVVAAAAFAARLSELEFWPGNSARLAAQLIPSEGSAGDFADDFAADASASAAAGPFALPALDEEGAAKAAAECAGDLGGQFALDFDYSTSLLAKRENRIRALRVTPVGYSGSWSALVRGSKGSVGYVEVDLETGKARLVEAEGGLKYGPSAVLGKDLMRLVRFRDRTALLGECHFEIDDSGRPRWIVQAIRKEAGLFGGPDTDGVFVVDAVSGSVERYREGGEPEWIDRVLSPVLAASHARNGLRLKNGWAKERFGGKKESLRMSEGYAEALVTGGSGAGSWLSAGVARPGGPEGTLSGFAMIDLRSKRAMLYAMDGVSEMKAMDAAQDDERAKGRGLSASWPRLASLSGRPVYAMSLRNSTERMYAFVDYATASRISLAGTAGEARSLFLSSPGPGGSPLPEIAVPAIESERAPGDGSLPSSPLPAGTPLAETRASEPGSPRKTKVTVLRVKESDGNVLFIAQGDPDTLYVAPLGLSNGVRFLKAGDSVELGYRESGSGGERSVVELKNLSLEQ